MAMTGAWRTVNDRLIYWYATGTQGDQYPEVTVEADGYWDVIHIGGRIRWSQTIDAVRIGLYMGIMPMGSLGLWYCSPLPTQPDSSGVIQLYFSLSPWHTYKYDPESGLTAGMPPLRLTTGNSIYLRSDGIPDEYQYFATLVVTLRRYDPPVGGAGGIDRSLYKDATGYVVP